MKILPAILILFFSCGLHAQQKDPEIGDPFPRQAWDYLSSQGDPRLSTDSLKNKLVILDFWATTCSSCVASFKGLDSLQKEFKGKVQFVLVTKEKKEKLDSVLAKIKKLKMPDVPQVYGDTVLSSIFYYATIPRHVWIDQEGKIYAMTSGYNTTGKTISMQLEGINPQLYVRKDIRGAKRGEAPPDPPFSLYYSIIAKSPSALRGGGGGTEKDSATRKIVKIHCEGTDVLNLLKIAANSSIVNGPFSLDNRVIVELPDAQNYYIPKDDTKLDYWADEHYYDYYIKVPPALSDKIYDFMKQDLERFFNLKANIEKRKVKCLVLVQKGPASFASKGGAWAKKGDEFTHDFSITNLPISFLVTDLTRTIGEDLNMPVVDGTGYKGNIDVSLVIQRGGIQSVKEQLKKYGLALVEGEKTIDMLVIRKGE